MAAVRFFGMKGVVSGCYCEGDRNMIGVEEVSRGAVLDSLQIIVKNAKAEETVVETVAKFGARKFTNSGMCQPPNVEDDIY